MEAVGFGRVIGARDGVEMEGELARSGIVICRRRSRPFVRIRGGDAVLGIAESVPEGTLRKSEVFLGKFQGENGENAVAGVVLRAFHIGTGIDGKRKLLVGKPACGVRRAGRERR